MTTNVRLQGKTAVVVGATGGLGAEITKRLARKECTLALVGRNEKRLSSLAKEILPAPSSAFVCDVSSSASVAHAYRGIMRQMKSADLVVFASGIGEPMDSHHFEAGKFEQTLRTNVLGVSYWLDLVLPEMIRRKEGTIVGISSLAAGRGLPGGASYCPSKAALSTLFECLRTDLEPLGIRVILVEPGFVATPLTAQLSFTPFLMRPDRAADIIVRGIEDGRPRIRFPWQLRLYAWIIRNLPLAAFDLVMRRQQADRGALRSIMGLFTGRPIDKS